MATLNQLTTFVAVADAGSVRAAAERLVVTQPAVSAALRALQASLGVPLVEPEGRGLRLTERGRIFATYARQILLLLDEARLLATGSDDPTRGRVRVAAVTSAGEHVLPQSLAVFRARYPDVVVTLDVGNREQVWSWMERGEADVALAGRPPADDNLMVRGRRANELILVAAPGLVAGHDDTSLVALARWTWLLREPGSGTRATLEALLTGHDLDPPTLTLGSNGAVVAGVLAGLGVTLISRAAVARQLADGDVVEIPTAETPIQRPWHAVTHRHMTPTTRLFVDHLVDPGGGRNIPRFERAPADSSGVTGAAR